VLTKVALGPFQAIEEKIQ